jgi:hypothetical protein
MRRTREQTCSGSLTTVILASDAYGSHGHVQELKLATQCRIEGNVIKKEMVSMPLTEFGAV